MLVPTLCLPTAHSSLSESGPHRTHASFTPCACLSCGELSDWRGLRRRCTITRRTTTTMRRLWRAPPRPHPGDRSGRRLAMGSHECCWLWTAVNAVGGGQAQLLPSLGVA